MRMVAVQSTACGPIVKAFEAREREVEASENVTTEVHGVRVSNPIGGGPGELSGCAPDAAYARIGCRDGFALLLDERKDVGQSQKVREQKYQED